MAQRLGVVSMFYSKPKKDRFETRMWFSSQISRDDADFGVRMDIWHLHVFGVSLRKSKAEEAARKGGGLMFV